MSTFKRLLAFLALLLIIQCTNTSKEDTASSLQKATYLHIAHTRTWENPLLVAEAERVDYSAYDMTWLGGDMAYQSSADSITLHRIDSIFDCQSPSTLWALGNHDYDHVDRVEALTGRPAFYHHHQNGLTFLVLDTQDSLSSIVGPQLALFRSVLDTLQHSSHLLLLHHKLLWLYDHPELSQQADQLSNAPFGDCFFCINPNNFYRTLYPELVKAQQKGIEVICLAGDIGRHSTGFEYRTPEGITFLASGIEFEREDNQVLLFEHDLRARTLEWEFRLLKELGGE
ncbi:MAG: hypothetical protein AAGG75_19770 [Bacteroidota bacterium]